MAGKKRTFRKKKDINQDNYNELSYKFDQLKNDYNKLEIENTRLEKNFKKEIESKYQEYIDHIEFLEKKIQQQSLEIKELIEKSRPKPKRDLFA